MKRGNKWQYVLALFHESKLDWSGEPVPWGLLPIYKAATAIRTRIKALKNG